MTRKKALLAILALAVTAALVACGQDPDPTPAPATNPSAIAPASPTAQPLPSPEVLPSPTPKPTATPVPSSSPTPPTPTPGSGSSTPRAAGSATSPPELRAGGVATSTLVAELAEKTWDTLVTLTDELSPRESATEEELVAAQYLLKELRALGYEAELQPFMVEVLSSEHPVLTVGASGSSDIQALPLRFSGEGQATGTVADVGRAFVDDIPAKGLTGQVALIERGNITFEEKVARVAEAGAVAAVIYNNVPGLFGGRLANQGAIPAVAISRESGLALKASGGQGNVEATVTVIIEVRDSRNVIAEKPGTDALGGVVVLGGHYDTVPDTQGANDNGSGIATMLTIAREVSETSFPFTLRFIAFGAEEVGLFGSRHYVDSLSASERDEIVAMLNFDALGEGPITAALGNDNLVAEVQEYGASIGVDVERRLGLGGGSSDHAPFEAVGIPILFFIADELSRINSPLDTIEHVQAERLGVAAALGLGLLDALAEQR